MNTNELLAAGPVVAGAHGQHIGIGLIVLALLVLGALGYGAVRLTPTAGAPQPPGSRARPTRPGEPPGSRPEHRAPGHSRQAPGRAAKPCASPGPPPPVSLAHPNGGWAVETHGLSKRFGATVAVDDVELLVPARLRLRLPRPERRGQDHADPHLARPDQGQRRHDVAARHPRPGRAAPGPGPGRGDRRRAPLPPAPDRPGQPSPAGRRPGRGRGPADRAVAGPGRPDRTGRGQGGRVLDGHAPAPRAWPRACSPTRNCSSWTSR